MACVSCPCKSSCLCVKMYAFLYSRNMRGAASPLRCLSRSAGGTGATCTGATCTGGRLEVVEHGLKLFMVRILLKKHLLKNLMVRRLMKKQLLNVVLNVVERNAQR